MILNKSLQHYPDDEMRSGFILVAVIGLILIISSVTLAFSISVRLRSLTADNSLLGLRYAQIGEVLKRRVAERVFANTQLGLTGQSSSRAALPCLFGEHSIKLEIQDHAGLIDLNTASVSLLNMGIQALGIREEKSSVLARAIDRYRRLDTGNHVEDEENNVIREVGYKHAAFEDIVELQDFGDLQSISPTAISAVFTVQSQIGTLSRNVAPDALKKIMGMQASNGQYFDSSLQNLQVLTVAVDIYRRKTLVFTSAAMFRLVGEKVMYVGPLIRSKNQDDAVIIGQTIACESVIDQSVMVALGKILK